jgi:hypothetical protein
MKKLVIAMLVAGTVALTGCGAANSGYAPTGGYTDWDWDLDHESDWNNKQYCRGSIYKPVAGGYTCVTNGVTSPVSPRPQLVKPPQNQQKAPATQPKPNTQPQQQKAPQQAPKPVQPAPKAPAPKAPAPKSGK